ncbi:hypothetical protein MNBD_GAMMA06-1628 [hydrothermal vent metagenome]|uniref:Cytochrome b561 bacterial/Ni-hydrogenase domain-containing protein n=1 Tax=hydrothermal vent metagenome TaxID=652676 RepID=A0A3B0X2V2_9ZZZZ
MVDLNYYDDWYQVAPAWHKSIGIVLASLLLFRILWMCFQIKPTPLIKNKWVAQLTSLTHAGMLFLLVIIVISGYLISTADGRAIVVFDLFEIPATITSIKNQEDISGEFHFYMTTILMLIAGLHAVAALAHHFIYKDKTLSRMLGISRSV